MVCSRSLEFYYCVRGLRIKKLPVPGKRPVGRNVNPVAEGCVLVCERRNSLTIFEQIFALHLMASQSCYWPILLQMGGEIVRSSRHNNSINTGTTYPASAHTITNPGQCPMAIENAKSQNMLLLWCCAKFTYCSQVLFALTFRRFDFRCVFYARSSLNGISIKFRIVPPPPPSPVEVRCSSSSGGELLLV